MTTILTTTHMDNTYLLGRLKYMKRTYVLLLGGARGWGQTSESLKNCTDRAQKLRTCNETPAQRPHLVRHVLYLAERFVQSSLKVSKGLSPAYCKEDYSTLLTRLAQILIPWLFRIRASLDSQQKVCRRTTRGFRSPNPSSTPHPHLELPLGLRGLYPPSDQNQLK